MLKQKFAGLSRRQNTVTPVRSQAVVPVLQLAKVVAPQRQQHLREIRPVAVSRAADRGG